MLTPIRTYVKDILSAMFAALFKPLLGLQLKIDNYRN